MRTATDWRAGMRSARRTGAPRAPPLLPAAGVALCSLLSPPCRRPRKETAAESPPRAQACGAAPGHCKAVAQEPAADGGTPPAACRCYALLSVRRVVARPLAGRQPAVRDSPAMSPNSTGFVFAPPSTGGVAGHGRAAVARLGALRHPPTGAAHHALPVRLACGGLGGESGRAERGGLWELRPGDRLRATRAAGRRLSGRLGGLSRGGAAAGRIRGGWPPCACWQHRPRLLAQPAVTWRRAASRRRPARA